MRLVLVVAALAACHRAPAPTPPANKAPAPDYAAAVADELAFVPIDSDVVIGLSLVDLRRSQMWQVFKPQLDELTRKFQNEGACPNFEPTRDFDVLTFGMKVRSKDDISAVIVMRGSASTRALECAISSARRKGGTVTVDRDVTRATDPSTPKVSAAYTIVGGSLVMEIGPSPSHDSLHAVLRAGAPLRRSPTFMAMYAKREPGAALWGMANGNSPMFDQIASSGMRPKSIDGTIVVTDLLGAKVRMTMVSPTEANALAAEIGKMKGMAGNYVTRFDVGVQGATAEIRVDLTESQIRAIAGMLGPLGP